MRSAKKADAPAFWDTSALALLCTHQPATGQARRIAQRCRMITTWWATPVEARSVFLRLQREGALETREVAEALKRLSTLRRSIAEILPTEEVRQAAESMLDKYALRAADAFQLGAAMVYCRNHPRDRWFVCFDQRLRTAADVAGFTVLPTEGRSSQ
jgi:predicted nucleic acid-binding protein